MIALKPEIIDISS